MDLPELLSLITPEVHTQLLRVVELGKWDDGTPLTREQRELCLQAVIAFEAGALPREQRTGYIDRGSKREHDRCASDDAEPEVVRIVREKGALMNELGTGALDKMRAELSAPVQYRLPVGESEIPLNALLGQPLRIEYLGRITCCNCARVTRRSFGQGYCYPCFQRLAACDNCIIRPQMCHFASGTCREPEWALGFCMSSHIVYLANSSGLKVGITRGNQVPTRWIDQGATQALPVLQVSTRQVSGFAEILFGESVADKTNWREMLKRTAAPLDLLAESAVLRERHRTGLDALRVRFGADAISEALASPLAIEYPVLRYPDKPQSLNLDKTASIEGTLTGIKGQYLLLDTGVLNVRNFTSYHVRVSA